MKDFNQISRRILKITIVSTLVGAVLVFGLHIWFKHNARTVLKQYISQQSNGKIKLELSELDLNLLINRLQIHEADLISTDSLNEPITYHVTFTKLSLRVTSLWSLLIKKELLLDSLRLQDPVIEVIQWRKDTAQKLVKDELSIPQEMGKVYRSMLDALNEFGIKRISIDNALFRLINKMKPGAEPVTVSKIFFALERSGANPKKGEEFIKNQTLELRTTNQNIAMPGGRHRIAFKSFQLQLLRQRIELDSCTVTAIPTDSSKSRYRI